LTDDSAYLDFDPTSFPNLFIIELTITSQKNQEEQLSDEELYDLLILKKEVLKTSFINENRLKSY
jgi:hypothetical protein